MKLWQTSINLENLSNDFVKLEIVSVLALRNIYNVVNSRIEESLR